MQDYLKEKTGQGTVPNVFINGKHLGKLSLCYVYHFLVNLYKCLLLHQVVVPIPLRQNRLANWT